MEESFPPVNKYMRGARDGGGGGLVKSSWTSILHFMSHETNSVIIDLWSRPRARVSSALLCYIKRLKSELKSILCPNKQFIFFNWSSMDMYTIKDFGSSRFNHNSQNSFSVYQDSQTTKMVDHSITKITFPPLNTNNQQAHCVQKPEKQTFIHHLNINELLAFVNPYCKSMDVFIWIAKARIP